MQNVALLVVDMQSTLLNLIPGCDSIIRRTCFALEAANLFGMKVFLTEQSPDKLGPTHSDVLAAAEIEDPQDNSVFSKDAFNALKIDALREELLDHGVQHLVIGGVETSICIYQTALGALDVELDVTLLSDCIGGRREADAGPILAMLQETSCYHLPSEAIFYSLLKSATHPAFRDFNRLVKKYSV